MALWSGLGRGVAGIVLVVVTLVTLVRLLGLDGGFPLVTVMTVFPYVVGGAVALTVVCALLQWYVEACVGGAVVLAGVALLLPRLLGGPTPAVDPEGPPFTVAVANLRVGTGDAGAVAAAVDRHGVDALVVLELTEDAVGTLGDAGLRRSLPYRTLLPSHRTSGGGIYSLHPLEPRAPSTQRRFGRTPRATITLDPGQQVELDAVHPLPPINASWTEAWRAALAALPPPRDGHGGGAVRILAGDFNATVDHRAFRGLLARGWVDAADAVGMGLWPTFSALGHGEPVPPVQLDHVLVDARTKVEEVAVEPLPGSDHRILIARLRLPGPATHPA